MLIGKILITNEHFLNKLPKITDLTHLFLTTGIQLNMTPLLPTKYASLLSPPLLFFINHIIGWLEYAWPL